jgi:hypothetical protein
VAEPKTRPTDADVDDFLAAIPHMQRRTDATAMSALMRDITGEKPVVWGTSIIGFGATESRRERGSPTSWPVIAFAARKTELVLYLNTSIEPEWFDGLGPHRRGVGCVYVKRLDDLDHHVLRRLLERSVVVVRRDAADGGS